MTRIEAETLTLTDLAISGPGGAYVSKHRSENYREPGTMEYVHSGAEAVYDIGIRALDESDGASTIEVILNGVSLETFTLDTTQPDGGNVFRDYVTNAVPLRDGDVLQLVINANAGEPGRVDYITLTDTGAPLPPLPLANIVISEIMQNPSAVGDSSGEYFELYNGDDTDVDINGWTIADADSDSHTIDNGGPLIIPAGGYIVLGNNSDTATNWRCECRL